jgi:hypothetical protein
MMKIQVLRYISGVPGVSTTTTSPPPFMENTSVTTE